MVGTLVKLGLGLSNRNTACVSRREVDVPRFDAMSHLQVPRRQLLRKPALRSAVLLHDVVVLRHN